jgi:Ca2+-binding RTX toxin-like protein
MRQVSSCGMLGGASSKGHMQREGEGAVVRQGRLIAVVAFLFGCAVLLVVPGCAGSQSQAPPKEDQGHIEATKEGQELTEATASEEEARCEGTRKTNVNLPGLRTTNDLPGCPKGGLLLGTDKGDLLAGEKGDDEVRGLGGSDDIMGGDGNDVLYGGAQRDFVGGYDGDDIIYGGPGNDGNGGVLVAGHGGDDVIYGGPGDDGNLVGFGGKDVIYGGPGDDTGLDVASAGEFGNDGQRDELYCGEGRDTYYAEKIDYVASSCEKKLGNSAPGPDDSMKPIE